MSATENWGAGAAALAGALVDCVIFAGAAFLAVSPCAEALVAPITANATAAKRILPFILRPPRELGVTGVARRVVSGKAIAVPRSRGRIKTREPQTRYGDANERWSPRH